MNTKTKCPDSETLERLARGNLTEDDVESLESHILDCDHCARRLDVALSDDDMVLVFHGAAAECSSTIDADATELQELIRRGRQLVSESPQKDSFESALACLLPARQPDDIGFLGGYRVLKVLGAGGMGVVLLAYNTELEREVALKVMRPEIAASAAACERFLREARAMAALDHENIVHIYRVGEDNGVPFIAMQLLKGECVRDRKIRQGKLKTSELLRIGREIAEGLAAAHRVGLIHRDIKPENIWIQKENGRVKLLDFGLARSTIDSVGLTQPGDFLGTPISMAPEQARGDEIDHRCDLFSLGVVLYQLASGVAPFKGRNLAEISMALAEQTATPLSDLVPSLPPEFSELIMQLLEKDRHKRPESSELVVRRIQTIERALSSQHDQSTESPVTRAALTSEGSTRDPLNRSLIVAGSFILLVALALLLKFRTPHGTVYVEIPDDVTIKEIEIDGENAAFAIDYAEGQLKFNVDAGAHELTIKTADGIALTTDLGEKPLKIHAGQDIGLRAWITRDKRSPVPAEMTDRQIAEHLLSIPNVDVHLTLYGMQDEKLGTVVSAKELPTGPFYLYSILVSDQEPGAFSATDLRVVGRALKANVFGYYSDAEAISTDEWIRFLESPAAKSGKLQNLDLNGGKNISDELIPKLNAIESLKFLTINLASLSNDGVRQLAPPHLLELCLSRLPSVSAESLESIAENCPSLRLLHLTDLDLQQADLRHLERLPLYSLSLRDAGIENHDLEPLAKLTGLWRLDLGGNAISAEGLMHLVNLPLEDLTLGGTLPSNERPLDDKGCEVLSQIKSLKGLYLLRNNITDQGISALASLPNLRRLTVNESLMTEDGLQLLVAVPLLEELNVRGCKALSPKAVEDFRASRPDCKVISDFGDSAN